MGEWFRTVEGMVARGQNFFSRLEVDLGIVKMDTQLLPPFRLDYAHVQRGLALSVLKTLQRGLGYIQVCVSNASSQGRLQSVNSSGVS